MSNSIPTQRAQLVADAVVSAYINEISAPARPRPPREVRADARAVAHRGRVRHVVRPMRRRSLEFA